MQCTCSRLISVVFFFFLYFFSSSLEKGCLGHFDKKYIYLKG